MTDAPVAACRNCRRPEPAGRLDQYGWCPACRAVVIRRATVVAHASAVVVSLLLAAAVLAYADPAPRFLMPWLLLVGVVHFLLFRVVRRVAFAVIRGRGVPPPEDAHAGHS